MTNEQLLIADPFLIFQQLEAAKLHTLPSNLGGSRLSCIQEIGMRGRLVPDLAGPDNCRLYSASETADTNRLFIATRQR